MTNQPPPPTRRCGLKKPAICREESETPHKPGNDGPAEPITAPLGLRWRVERTNSWLSNYGQLRRNTDRKPEHRLAQLALAVALIITLKLIDHRNRWQPHNRPIR